MSPDTAPYNSRPWALGSLLVLMILSWWQWPGLAAPERTTSFNSDSGVVSPEAPPDTKMLAQAGRREELQQSQEPSALDQFRERTRYPASTRKINEKSFDLLNPGARHENRQALPGPDNPDMAWQVLFTADRFFVTGDEPVLISLQLWNRGEAVSPESVSLQAEAVGPGDHREPVMLTARSDGRAKTTVFEPNSHWPEYVGRVRVSANFSARDLKPQSGELDFFFTGKERVPAHFTGTFRDFMADGDLLIEVGLDVHRDGIFRIDGNLFDRAGKPFGWARFEGPLAQGNAVAALRYYGLLFHDAEAQAPFTLRNLHGYRMRLGDVPDREHIPQLATDYQTGGNYSLQGFRSQENHSPRRQRMIEMYEDAERRGVKLTRPENPGDG